MVIESESLEEKEGEEEEDEVVAPSCEVWLHSFPEPDAVGSTAKRELGITTL